MLTRQSWHGNGHQRLIPDTGHADMDCKLVSNDKAIKASSLERPPKQVENLLFRIQVTMSIVPFGDSEGPPEYYKNITFTIQLATKSL